MANIPYYEGTRQYIGPRFVPKFAEPLEWNAQTSYEQLTIVSYLGASYTSKKPVQAGIQPTNTEYWALTGNYNSQIEEYRKEVEGVQESLDTTNNTISDIDTGFNNYTSAADYTKGKTIVIFGDSYAAGIPIGVLRAALPYATIYQYAVGGSTLANLTADRVGLEYQVKQFRTLHPGLNPDIVLVLGFNNDVGCWARNDYNLMQQNIFGNYQLSPPITDTWDTCINALMSLCNEFLNVRGDTKFGWIPIANVTHNTFYPVAKSFLYSLLSYAPHKMPVSILWDAQLYEINEAGVYWVNNMGWHPTNAYYTGILIPILAGWLRNGMVNHPFPYSNYSVVTYHDINTEFEAGCLDIAKQLITTVQASPLWNTQYLPPNLYGYFIQSGTSTPAMWAIYGPLSPRARGDGFMWRCSLGALSTTPSAFTGKNYCIWLGVDEVSIYEETMTKYTT